MTDAEKTADSLIEQFGIQKAHSHVNFVLSKEFGLSKQWQIDYWNQVRRHIHQYYINVASDFLQEKIVQK